MPADVGDTLTISRPETTETSQRRTTAPPWRDTFVSLRIRNYRLFVLSQIVANTGLWMQRVAQDWLVLQLTHSPAAVGVTVALQFTPMLFFGLFGGVLADRHSKRLLLIMTQTTAGILALTLAALTLTGQIYVWQVYGVAILLGFVTVVDNPARQVFVNEMVGPEHLRNAISLNSSIFQLGGLVGPALAGVLIRAVGEGWSFGLNAMACCGVVITLLLMRPTELHTSPVAERTKGQLRDGLRYVRSQPSILWTVVLVAFVAVFGMNMPVLLSAFSTTVFHVGAGGYGLFNSLVALGALAGALGSTRRTGIRLRALVAAAVAFGSVQAIAGIAPNRLAYSLALVAVGAATLTFLTGANSLVQMTASLSLRGRVMSLYVLVLLGGQAIGGVLMGRITQTLGPRDATLISGLVPVVASLGVAVLLARRTEVAQRPRVWPMRLLPQGH